MQLNKQQKQALKRLQQFIKNQDEKYIILTGYAGTGKSTLLKQLYENTPVEWLFTATTNKAKNALSEILDVDVTTIHSLLGLKPYSTQSNVIVKDVVLVIDECSYIDYTLLDIILNSCQCKIIFVGDDTQLTPIGLNHCPAFEQDYPVVKLETIVRQQTATDLMQICNDLRDCIVKKTSLKSFKPSANFQKVDRETFNDLIKKEFNRTNWKPNDSKILAIKNTTVNKHNSHLFQAIYQRKHYEVGDVIISNHYVDGIKTDEQVEILSIEKANLLDVKGHYYSLKSNKGIVKVFMPTDTRRIASLKKQKDIIADLRPIYACTVHKSQGSTYDQVFIDLKDFIDFKGTQQELARLLYVAISRAKYKVIITED